MHLKNKNVVGSLLLFLILSACASTPDLSHTPLPVLLKSATSEKHVEIERHELSESLIEDNLTLEVFLKNPKLSIKPPYRSVFSIYMDTLYLPEGANLRIAMCSETTACLYRAKHSPGSFKETLFEMPIIFNNQTLEIPIPNEVLMDAWEYKSSLERDGTNPRNGILLWSSLNSAVGTVSLRTNSKIIPVPSGLQEPLLELTK